jgi:mRNA-degrading endonuclease RelE of RelBE toxin-antitoxin system
MESGRIKPEQFIEGINEIQRNTGNKNTIQGELFEVNTDKTYNVKVTDDRGVEIVLFNRKSATDISFVVNDTLDTASSLSLQVNMDCPNGDLDRSVITGFSGYNLPKEPTVRHFSTSTTNSFSILSLDDSSPYKTISVFSSAGADIKDISLNYTADFITANSKYIYSISEDGHAAKYDRSGNLLSYYNTGLSNCSSIAVDPGNFSIIYTVDTSNDIVYQINFSSQSKTSFTSISGDIYEIATNSTGFYVSWFDAGVKYISKYSSSGSLSKTVETSQACFTLRCDVFGNVYGFSGNYIYKFSSSLVLQDTFSISTSETPSLAIDEEGNMYIYNSSGGYTPVYEIEKYDNEGSKTSSWEAEGLCLCKF